MLIPLPKIPFVFRASLHEFEGPDPWDGDRPIPWILALYALGHTAPAVKPGITAADVKREFPNGHLLGLFSRATNRCHPIPVALREHWQQNRITAEALPALLYHAERTNKTDPEIFRAETHLRNAAVVMTTIGICMVVAGLALWYLNRLEAAAVCGFIGLMLSLMGPVMFGYDRFLQWRCKRVSERWLRLAQEL